MGQRVSMVHRLLLRAYPSEFRRAFGAEMMADFAAYESAARARGEGVESVRLWLFADAVRSGMRERWYGWRAQLASRRTHAQQAASAVDVQGALVAGFAVFMLYWLTLAPTVAFWDAGEYITVAHVAGIPHPPGNPLFVLLARAWDVLLGVTGLPAAVRINVFSAFCSAAAHAFLYLCIDRAFARSLPRSPILRRITAGVAVLMSATAFTVWNQSNVNEKVYTVSFLTVLAASWLVLRWRDTRDARLLLLAAYVTALTAANHLMGVLVVPALVAFVWTVDRRVFWRPRLMAAVLPALLIAFSAHLFLPVRAAERPVVNESDPVCESATGAAVSVYSGGRAGCTALSATLRREQYGERSLLQDPNAPGTPRSAALLASQLVNYAQYLDWQWARSISGESPLFGGARPAMTLLIILLACAGGVTHWRNDRAAALLHGVLLATFSVGLVVYLNFRYGYSIGHDIAPDARMHEVRERDYFFLIGFSLFGAWAGLGIVALWRRFAVVLGGRMLAAAPVLGLALLPLVLNWTWASRADDWTARDWAYNVLMSVEPYGVLVTNGDNDSFPLWYLQHVEHVREDVTIVLSPYLGAAWYARQVRDASRPCAPGTDMSDRTVITCQRPFDAGAVHPKLLAAWGGAPDEPPRDSVLNLTDAQIDEMAASWFVADQPLPLRAGDLRAEVAAGTFLTPVDTFVAAIVQASWGRRPIHFMTPSSAVSNLGLGEHTIRSGLTWRLADDRSGRDLVRIPAELQNAPVGQYVDLGVTDTLLTDVFIVRGRATDQDLPWVDHANLTIPVQYSLAYYAAAVAHELRGEDERARAHMQRLETWSRFTGS